MEGRGLVHFYESCLVARVVPRYKTTWLFPRGSGPAPCGPQSVGTGNFPHPGSSLPVLPSIDSGVVIKGLNHEALLDFFFRLNGSNSTIEMSHSWGCDAQRKMFLNVGLWEKVSASCDFLICHCWRSFYQRLQNNMFLLKLIQ